MKTRDKIINHLTIHGKKHTSEKNLLKSLKKLQKESRKKIKELLKLAIVLSSPTFKLHTLTQKKRKKKKGREIPAFINKERIRISLAIKNILKTAKERQVNHIFLSLKNEFLETAQEKSETIDLKRAKQEQILTKKHLLRYYRWN